MDLRCSKELWQWSAQGQTLCQVALLRALQPNFGLFQYGIYMYVNFIRDVRDIRVLRSFFCIESNCKKKSVLLLVEDKFLKQ